MDRGPVRVSRSASSRPEARRSDETTQQPLAATSESRQTAAPHHAPAPRQVKDKKNSKSKSLVATLIVAIIVLLAVVGWLGWSKLQTTTPAIDSGKYQAVFFTNGQVYFGKLVSLNGDYVKLSDVFYLQSQGSGDTESENPQKGSDDSGNFKLIKLGQEVHGPEDAMIISREQILFYENLKSDGKVAQTIEQYKSQ